MLNNIEKIIISIVIEIIINHKARYLEIIFNAKLIREFIKYNLNSWNILQLCLILKALKEKSKNEI